MPPGRGMRERVSRYSFDPAALEKKLMVLLGATLEEIFPDELSGSKIARKSLEKEKDMFVPVDQVVAALGTSAPLHLLPYPQELEVYTTEQNEILNNALSRLTPGEEMVIRARFGLDGPPQSLHDIAERDGRSRERIRQVEARALRKLRDRKGGLWLLR